MVSLLKLEFRGAGWLAVAVGLVFLPVGLLAGAGSCVGSAVLLPGGGGDLGVFLFGEFHLGEEGVKFLRIG